MKKLIFMLTIITLISINVFGQKGNTWVQKNKIVSGNWSIEVENGKSYLVLHADFKTSKGPDLKLFLTKKDASMVKRSDAVEKYGILLGKLKSIKGKQKYLIPAHISISAFKSIVIHCEEYTKVWGVGSL